MKKLILFLIVLAIGKPNISLSQVNQISRGSELSLAWSLLSLSPTYREIYYYKGEKYKRFYHLKSIFYETGDKKTINYYKASYPLIITGYIIVVPATAALVCGGIWYLLLGGDYGPESSFFVISGVAASIGFVTTWTGYLLRDKTIERFNTLQLGNQNVQLDIMLTNPGIGIGLTWNLNY